MHHRAVHRQDLHVGGDRHDQIVRGGKHPLQDLFNFSAGLALLQAIGQVNQCAGDRGDLVACFQCAARHADVAQALLCRQDMKIATECLAGAQAATKQRAHPMLVFLKVEECVFRRDVGTGAQIEEFVKAVRPADVVALGVHLPDAQLAGVFSQFQQTWIERFFTARQDGS